jgi:hypothetical protein
LRFPNRAVFDNKSLMTGEEVFIRSLYELVRNVNCGEVWSTSLRPM